MMDLHDKILPLILYTLIHLNPFVKLAAGVEFNVACGETQTVNIGQIFTFDENMLRDNKMRPNRLPINGPLHIPPMDNNLDSPSAPGPYGAPNGGPYGPPAQNGPPFGSNPNEVIGPNGTPTQYGKLLDPTLWRQLPQASPNQGPPSGPGIPPVPSILEQPTKVSKIKQDIISKSAARDSKVVKYKDYWVNKGQRRPSHERRSGKFPAYVQHMMEHKTIEAKTKPFEVANNPIASISNQELLGMLEPKKLDQLRHLLNSGSKSRLKRSLPSHIAAKFGRHLKPDEGTQCIRTFIKDQNCNQLVVKIHYWLDGVKNCNLEGLSITGVENGPELLCGPNGGQRTVYITGNKASIQHFRNALRNQLRFKGTVSCE